MTLDIRQLTLPEERCPGIGYGTLPVRRILVVQTQRLGDVLCVTPVFTALRRRFPRAHLTAMVHRPMDEILAGSPDLDEVMAYDRHTTHRSFWSRLLLIPELREHGFDWALVIHAASSIGFALWQAGIPWRTCVWRYDDYRKPHWARWYHQHVRQDRRKGEKHEIEYNLDVLRELGIEPDHEGYRVWLRPEEREWAAGWLRERGRDESRPLALIHPGHGGGRQAWPARNYGRVADGLVRRGFQVAVTGSGREKELVEQVISSMQGSALALAGGTSLRQFAAVISQARLLVSVSTGPMHLASALDVPTVTLYGPTDLRTDAVRFSPYRSATQGVYSPTACVCASSHTCVQPVCMAGITPEKILEAADRLGSAQGVAS